MVTTLCPPVELRISAVYFPGATFACGAAATVPFWSTVIQVASRSGCPSWRVTPSTTKVTPLPADFWGFAISISPGRTSMSPQPKFSTGASVGLGLGFFVVGVGLGAGFGAGFFVVGVGLGAGFFVVGAGLGFVVVFGVVFFVVGAGLGVGVGVGVSLTSSASVSLGETTTLVVLAV